MVGHTVVPARRKERSVVGEAEVLHELRDELVGWQTPKPPVLRGQYSGGTTT